MNYRPSFVLTFFSKKKENLHGRYYFKLKRKWPLCVGVQISVLLIFDLIKEYAICLLYIAGVSKPPNRSPPMPQRSPPPPPSSAEATRNVSQPSVTCGVGGTGGSLGAFWSTQHAKTSVVVEENSLPKFDEEPTNYSSTVQDRNRPDNHPLPKNTSPVKDEFIRTNVMRRNVHDKPHKPEDGPSRDVKLNFFHKDTDSGVEKLKASRPDTTAPFRDEAFNSFVAEFDTTKLNAGTGNNKSGKEEALEVEIERLKAQLKQANLEKAEMTSKFERLSAICRSQRQEIQELKQALATRSLSPNKDTTRNQISPVNQSSATPLVLFLII